MDPQDKNLPPDPPPSVSQLVSDVAGLPGPLSGDPKRQPVAPISGCVYQARWSIDAWLRLSSADDVIYLECGEDFDIGRQDGTTAVQVRRTGDPLSLGNEKAREALEHFWTLAAKDPSRPTEYLYLTTSSVAMERDAQSLGLSGIEARRAARTNIDLVAKVASYLTAKRAVTSPLRAVWDPAGVLWHFAQPITENANLDVPAISNCDTTRQAIGLTAPRPRPCASCSPKTTQ